MGNKNSKTQYKINNNIITEANTIKDLGVTIDNRLTFSEYISHIIRVVYLKMKTLFKILKLRSSKTWITAYKSYIRPILEYATEVWNPILKIDIKRIEKCQKFYTKVVLKNVDYRTYLIKIS